MWRSLCSGLGTGIVGHVFGPVMALRLRPGRTRRRAARHRPQILEALSPSYGAAFSLAHPEPQASCPRVTPGAPRRGCRTATQAGVVWPCHEQARRALLLSFAITSRLCDSAPVDARGVARLRLVITDGRRALLQTRSPHRPHRCAAGDLAEGGRARLTTSRAAGPHDGAGERLAICA
jgi:hypothetical protein